MIEPSVYFANYYNYTKERSDHKNQLRSITILGAIAPALTGEY
jgi:hypothetical protein